MLLQLIIRNFALIEKLDIDFGAGLNILTGETGAGKSIIIDAVSIGLGERADKSYVRTGTQKATIQMIFKSNNPKVDQLLIDKGMDLLDEEIVLTRELYATGRSVSRINDHVVTTSLLKEISKYLIDIHGQHAHQSLMFRENHIDMLDALNESTILPLKSQIFKKYNQLKSLQKQLKSFTGDELEFNRKKDLLKFQLNEIDVSRLKKGEEEDLFGQYQLYSNSEKIFQTLSDAYQTIYTGEKFPGMIDNMNHIIHALEDIKECDSKILSIYDTLQDCLYTMEDLSRDIRNTKDSIEFDPSALDEIEKRLNHIQDLKSKYGNSIDEILLFRDKIWNELNRLENSETLIAKLQEEITKTTKEYLKIATDLSELRKSVSKDLEDKMVAELKNLNMNNVGFKVKFSIHDIDVSRFTPKGIDQVEFLISTNKGESLKPLSKIASGGEMSRIMLAFKTILAHSDQIPTLIFDEIDTGISGRTASIVGEKLAKLSENHQILCITHLPQIAAMADDHFYIEKKSNEETTLTHVYCMNEDERVMELGRLIGGLELTELTKKHAKEMIDASKAFKKKYIH